MYVDYERERVRENKVNDGMREEYSAEIFKNCDTMKLDFLDSFL